MPHCLPFSDVLKLLCEAKKDSEFWWLLLAMIFIYGLRVGEITGRKTQRTNRKTKEITVGEHKGLRPADIVGIRLKLPRLKGSYRCEDELLVHEYPVLNVRQAMLDLCAKTDRNQRLFPVSVRTIRRRIREYGKRAGLPEDYCHPHMLKHSILDYLRPYLDVKELQERSGHKTLNSLGVYLHPKKAVVDAKVNAALGSASA